MSNAMQPPDEVSDKASIERNAESREDRRLALDACLTGVWADADIGRLERVDRTGWHGWMMWKWKKA